MSDDQTAITVPAIADTYHETVIDGKALNVANTVFMQNAKAGIGNRLLLEPMNSIASAMPEPAQQVPKTYSYVTGGRLCSLSPDQALLLPP
jgi:hypothetical protein